MSERLEMLRPVLAQYTRRFTVLDLGAGINHPTLGYEIAQEFDSVVVEVEKGWLPAETGPRTIVLKHEFTVDDLVRLGECCHFDVVLAFNFIHWFEAEWRQAAEAVMGMGDYVFVQIPTDQDIKAPGYFHVESMHGYLKEHGEWLGSTSQFPRHPPRPIYMHKNGVKTLTRTNWEAHASSAEIAVLSTHKAIQAEFRHKQPPVMRDWIPGINLWNFCKLGGVVPSLEQVLEMIHNLPKPPVKHGDIQPWNMILDGERLHLIDGGDEWGGSDTEGVERSLRKVTECLTTS